MASRRRKPPAKPSTPATATSTLHHDVTPEPTFGQQVQSVGGDLSPQMVTSILMAADGGQCQRLVDFFHECRQRDGHLQSVAQSRELAVASLPILIYCKDDASRTTKKMVKLAGDALAEIQELPSSVAHLTGETSAFAFSYVQNMWGTVGKFFLPTSQKNVHCRRFYFERQTGHLLFSDTGSNGVSLDKYPPGKFLSYRARVNGDIPAREGLSRVSSWYTMFRNWGWKDFLELAELAWKPKRLAKYNRGGKRVPPENADEEDIKIMKNAVKRILTDGVAWIPDTTDLDLIWPTGSNGASTHRDLLREAEGELSKAWLGQTDMVTPGENGAKSAVKARDQLRLIIRDYIAMNVARTIQNGLVRPLAAYNTPASLDPIYVKIDTTQKLELTSLATAVKVLVDAGMRIPERYVREQAHPTIPEIQPDDIVLEAKTKPAPPGFGGPEDGNEDPESDGTGDEPEDESKDDPKPASDDE